MDAYPTSFCADTARIRGTRGQIVEVSLGRATLDGRVATSLFYHQVLDPTFSKATKGFTREAKNRFSSRFQFEYKENAKVSSFIFTYMTLEELEPLVLDALRKTAALVPSVDLPGFEALLPWATWKAMLDKDIERAVTILHAENVKRKREIEQDLEECEKVLKRFKKE